ncbi:peptidyl-prolyl cis-trans isomerase E-like [Brevipalpus obovatus]|uniref:peptidyl-prolyl cis-trans isomerase E-like n=1 Tax=Brevipalpus obovatus TaxID=246614 RepID=UPI003D9EC4C5
MNSLIIMTANKRIIYVGGLSEEVDSKILHAAFIPFGDIIDINMPIDFATQKHRGFAFIEFESVEDAGYAIDNMNDAEIYGKTIRVNIAKPIKLKEGSARPVWSDDEWLRKHAGVGQGPDEVGKETEKEIEERHEKAIMDETE